MKTVYVCTHVSKEVEEDDYEHGCLGERRTVWEERCNLEAPTLLGLLEKLREGYILALDDLFIPDDGESGVVQSFGYNQSETSLGDEPTPAERELWKGGGWTLFLADYSFCVEKRTVEPIPLEEFRAAGAKIH